MSQCRSTSEQHYEYGEHLKQPKLTKQQYAAELDRIRRDWEELGKAQSCDHVDGESRSSSLSGTAKQSAKETLKSWAPKYRKFQDVVMGITVGSYD